MSWAPVHSAHAIERIRFEVIFVDALPKKVIDAQRRLFEAQTQKFRFDAVKDQKTQKIFIGEPSNKSPIIQESEGWQSVRIASSTMQPAEVVVLNPQMLVYESSEYRNWTTAKKRFISVVGEMISRISDIVDFRSFSHDYTDRFVFQGAPEKANAKLILCGELFPLLPENTILGNELWHIHRGWFETRNGLRILINQNLDMQDGTTHIGDAVRSLQIYTKAEARLDADSQVVSDLEEFLSNLHLICNENFAQVLSGEGREMLHIDQKGAGGHG